LLPEASASGREAVTQDTADKWVEALLQFWSGEIGAVLGTENSVVEILCE
jgi:hypothetical protein